MSSIPLVEGSTATAASVLVSRRIWRRGAPGTSGVVGTAPGTITRGSAARTAAGGVQSGGLLSSEAACKWCVVVGVVVDV